MIFSYKTLSSLANLKTYTVEDVVEAINSIGFEVEEYRKFSDVEGIQICYVLKTYKNPEADRLTVCEVEYGDGHKAIIQTTATNMKEGQYVMSFVPGSRSKKTIFQPRKMQGIVSEGMFVGLSEIGFDPEVIPEEFQDQIFQLEKIDLNIDPISYFDLDDYLIDVSILSNRADAQSYLVMAKELAAYFDTEIKWPRKANPNLLSNFEVTNLKSTKAFSLIEASNNNLKTSLKEKMLLWKHGIKTFSNAVDLTNLVLLFAGVPCHVYSKEDLESNQFSVDYYTGKLNILGNKEIEVENALVVKNGDTPVSLAATIGLQNKQFNPQSQKAIFEIASFNILDVRKNSKQIKLTTDASQRASRDISNGSVVLAYNFLAKYLSDYSIQINAPKLHKKTILIDKAYLTKFAGFSISKTKKYHEILGKLATLDFKFKSDFSAVTFPTYRYDLESIQDFVEEVFRFYGYNNFPLKQPKLSRLNYEKNENYNFIKMLANKDYSNVRTYTLIKPENNKFNPFNFEETLNAKDSKNYDHSQIRLSFIEPLNEILTFNKKQGFDKGSYFDIGMIGREMDVLGIISNSKQFNEIKKDIISLTNQNLEFRKSSNEIFNPNVSADIFLNNEKIGYIAKIHPKLINNDAIFVEMKLNKIKNISRQFKNYRHEPLKNRDITIELKNNESISSTIQKLKNIIGIHQCKIIDVYQKTDNLKAVTLSIKIEDWAIKQFDKDFNN
ncbi:phenylalanine--tRNA ligase subunit beta [Metamycoplasma phocicerebrale]|uniref:Phenylalanine--tRNA ligase beta subunit n=1 Tax=Metamycoplasma phocicerebrale TaxID=142649 RepID=A0A3T0TTX6_9BACT|nr:phenylalanine--tRNA ligase subunit beta [Metamycoplasma phocicerebrale]AZZ65473.1 phenylalanine--tRNA ligase subunit beta [Metamycoplasma phocicerebrale]